MADDNENSKFDRLAHDSSQLSELTEEGIMTYFEEILALVAYDKARGIDISKVYPVFYEQLNHSRILRSAFEDALSVMEEPQRPTSVLSPEPQPTLSRRFLTGIKPKILQEARDRWQMSWTVVKQNMQVLLDPIALPSVSVRSRGEGLGTIIKCKELIDDLELDILLRIPPPANEEFVFKPRVTIQALHGRQISTSLEATLQWGRYLQTVHIPESGVADLPPIDVEMVFDENEKVANDLRFELKQI